MTGKLFDRLMQIRLFRYAMTGGLATLTHVLVAFAVLKFISGSVFIANVAGFGCAFVLSYLLQSLFVFKQQLSFSNAKRFFLVQFSALLLSQLISELFRDTNSYLRVLLVVLMLPAITYLIHKFWTYADSTGIEKKHN